MNVNIVMMGSVANAKKRHTAALQEHIAKQKSDDATVLASSPMGHSRDPAVRKQLQDHLDADLSAATAVLTSTDALVQDMLSKLGAQGVTGVSVSVTGNVTARSASLNIVIGELTNYIG